MGRVQQIRKGEPDIETSKGWYAIRNSRRLHYFSLQENSLCGAHTWHEPLENTKELNKCLYCQKKLNDEKFNT